MKTMSTRDTIAELVGAGSAGGGEEEQDETTPPDAGADLDAGAATDDIEQAPVEEQGAKATPQEQASGTAAEGGASRQAPPKPEAPAGTTLKPSVASDLKAPADWRPAAKEKWGALPREVQEEAIRLHTEIKKTLQDSSQARQTADAFQRTVAPYEHMFRAVGKSPVEGVGWLVQQYAALQTAPAPQRRQIVAGIIRDFLGDDEASLQALGSTIDGTRGGAAPAAPAAPLRPEQIQQLVRQEAQRMQGEASQQAEIKAIQDFEASAPEYLNALTNEIAALVTIEKRQGKPITVEMLKQVHAKALRINPETAAILKQRDDAAAAAKRAADDKKKQAAATGIKNEPAGPGAPAKAVSTRDEVKRQMDRLKGGARV